MNWNCRTSFFFYCDFSDEPNKKFQKTANSFAQQHQRKNKEFLAYFRGIQFEIEQTLIAL